MSSLKRDVGLIRMDTENRFKKNKKIKFRLRPIIYGSILILLSALLITALSLRSTLSLHVTRHEGPPYGTLPTGEYTNTFRFTFQNNSPRETSLKLKIKGSKIGKIICGRCNSPLASLESIRVPVIVVVPKSEVLDKITLIHTESGKEVELPFIRPNH
jgi:polyferredoxin